MSDPSSSGQIPDSSLLGYGNGSGVGAVGVVVGTDREPRSTVKGCRPLKVSLFGPDVGGSAEASRVRFTKTSDSLKAKGLSRSRRVFVLNQKRKQRETGLVSMGGVGRTTVVDPR